MTKNISSGLTVGAVLRCLCRHPYRHIVRRWNWKTACLSSLSRGLIILLVFLPFGAAGAVHGMTIEMLYRGMLSGFFSAVIQAFRVVRPFWAASVVTMILIPGMADVIGVSAQWIYGTGRFESTMAVSLILTGISVFIELHAMRSGALVVGGASHSLLHDLKRMPSLILLLLTEAVNSLRLAMRQIQKLPAAFGKMPQC